MRKIILILSVVLLIVFLGLAAFAVYIFDYIKREEIVKMKTDDAGRVSIEIREEEKGFLRDIAEKVAKIIYDEATKHNPEGDMLPDGIDDRIKEEIKAKVN